MSMVTRFDALAARVVTADRRADSAGADSRQRAWSPALLCCLALSGLAFATRPGRILADTKIDLAENPLGFLGRALHLWDPEQFGQVQNQAAGYLFPLGPFYALGHLVRLPEWITQRLLIALLLCAAFLGARKLAARLRIGGPVTQLTAGLAYALAPNGLATLGQISSEYLPFAMLPWIVLPLVTAAEGGSRIRAAARSGIAVALCGGINATATIAVLTVPAIYVLTRPRGTARGRLLGWWSTAVVCATAWWSITLPLVGGYTFSWLTYTEKAATTTAPTGLVNVFRGTERWVNYLVINGRVWWPVGNILSVSALAVLFTGLVAALGLAGLLRSRLPERTFLLLTLLAGVAIIGAGHVSVIEGPLAAPFRELLDGPLAPLRNLHKFDGLIRLPISFGIAHLLSSLRRPRARLTALATTALALAVVAAPALTGGLAGPGDFQRVPTYWRNAADWLNSRAGDQAVLALPGSAFGEYQWGRPMDDIMQPLLRSRWGVRQLVPAGSPGYTRLLDAIDERVAAGGTSAGLAEVLGRMGVRYVLVRNDLARETLNGAWPARLHQSLDHSPGLRKVASFGDPVGAADPGDAVSMFDQRYAPLEVYEVGNADDVVSLADAGGALRVYGSPETLLTMADDGLLRGRTMLLNGDAPDIKGESVVSDQLRAVERNFGEVRQTSPTLTRSPQADAPTRDVMDKGWERYSTFATYSGIKDITASTSRADFDAISGQHDLGLLPYAAMDGNPLTQWESGGWSGPIGQWLEVDLQQPTVPADVTVTFAQNPYLGPPPSRIAVETQGGVIQQDVTSTSAAQRLVVPSGATSWLRIRVLRLAGTPTGTLGSRVAISELHLGSVRAVRQYHLPAAPAGGGPSVVVMARSPGAAPTCMQGSIRWVCTDLLARGDEDGTNFARVFSASSAARASVSGRATLNDLGLIEKYTTLKSQISVTGTSSLSSPVSRPRSAFDGDPATTWVPGANDTSPALTVGWPRRITIDHLKVERPPLAAGPLQVRLEGDRGSWREGAIDSAGRLKFAPFTTGRLTIYFKSAQSPLQITDVTIPGVPRVANPGAFPLRLPCGFGPTLTINGKAIPSRVTATMGDLLAGRSVEYQGCKPAALTAGDNRLEPRAFDPYRIDSAIVDPGGALATGSAPQSSPVTVRAWTPEVREVEVQAERQSYLVVNENYNQGWEARAGSELLRPIRLDGWKQAWVVPAGTQGLIRLHYRPDPAYRAVVLVGLNLLLVLLFAAFWPVRSRRPDTAAPPHRSPVGRWIGVAAAAAFGLWLGGPAGAIVCALVAVVPHRRLGGRARFLVPGVILLAAVSQAVSQWWSARGGSAGPADVLGDIAPQLLGLIVVARLIAALTVPPRDLEDPPDQIFGGRPHTGAEVEVIWRTGAGSDP
jgi:arabinofuranan 3-O-arabinosyltransferase